MGRTRLLFVAAALAAASLACLFLVAGCGHEAASPVGPGGIGQDGQGLGALQYVLDNYGDPFDTAFDSSASRGGPQLGAGKWTLSTASDTATVDNEGGTITLNFGALTSTLEIPADAVCAEDDGCAVTITASAFDFTTPFGNVLLYDFGPSGLTFAKPCDLTVNTGFDKGQWVSLFWFNPAIDVWELQQRVQVLSNGEIEFTVTHFSKYGIS